MRHDPGGKQHGDSSLAQHRVGDCPTASSADAAGKSERVAGAAAVIDPGRGVRSIEVEEAASGGVSAGKLPSKIEHVARMQKIHPNLAARPVPNSLSYSTPIVIHAGG